MPIRPRQKSSTGFYHVVVRGINGELIYNQQRERIYFKKIILEHLKKYQVEIFAFCIMSNHAHILIRAELQELSMFMARILAEYASYYNYKHNRNGHVFQNRFLSECVETEAYFWNCIRYIHMNPVKANMVKTPLQYKYSSMNEYGTEVPVIIHQNALEVYRQHFLEYEAFEKFHQGYQYDVFKDIPDEIKEQQLEIAIQIMKDMFKENDLPLEKIIFEEKVFREQYIEKVQKMLNISNKITKELYAEVKSIAENR